MHTAAQWIKMPLSEMVLGASASEFIVPLGSNAFALMLRFKLL